MNGICKYILFTTVFLNRKLSMQHTIVNAKYTMRLYFRCRGLICIFKYVYIHSSVIILKFDNIRVYSYLYTLKINLTFFIISN